MTSEPAIPDELLRSAYDICTSCKGHGLQDGMHGPVACGQCHGDCTVRVRDEHGRFATRPLVLDPKTGGWS